MITVALPIVTGFTVPVIGMLGALAPPVAGYVSHMYCQGIFRVPDQLELKTQGHTYICKSKFIMY